MASEELSRIRRDRVLSAGGDSLAFARLLGIEPFSWQADVLQSSSNRILLNCSRQAGKSTVASILALHTALYYAKSLILLVSPSSRQSAELFRRVQEFLVQIRARGHLVEDKKLSLELENGSRIVALPSNEATVRGFSGARLIIEDEASRVLDAFYNAIRPMLAVSGGRLLLMSTPWGKRGHFFEEWESGGPDWQRVRVPATECALISPTFLQQEFRSVGEWSFKQEYLCEFVETVDQVFGHEFIMSAISGDVLPLFPTLSLGRFPGMVDGTSAAIKPLFPDGFH